MYILKLHIKEDESSVYKNSEKVNRDRKCAIKKYELHLIV